MINEQTLSIYLAVVAGIVAFLCAYLFLISGARSYRKSFLARVGNGLKSSFIFLDPRLLFAANVIVLAVGGLLGLWLAGVFGLIVSIIFIAILPGIMLKVIRRRRIDRFIYQLPDCLGSMASSLRAGTHLMRAIEQMVIQQPAPVSQEFAVVLSEYRMGRGLDQALADMCRRIGSNEVELLTSAISISRAVGGNLADTVETLADTLREKGQMEGKIRALTAMGRMQGWVVGALPVLLLAVLYRKNPASIQPLFTEPLGWVTLAILGIMMTLAVFMICKIVNIDV